MSFSTRLRSCFEVPPAIGGVDPSRPALYRRLPARTTVVAVLDAAGRLATVVRDLDGDRALAERSYARVRLHEEAPGSEAVALTVEVVPSPQSIVTVKSLAGANGLASVNANDTVVGPLGIAWLGTVSAPAVTARRR